MTLVRRAGFAFLLTTLLGGVVYAASQPPANLHLAGDHWTAWDPPQTFPPDAEIYIVRSGDTLWDLASRFYGDPYLWPQLWERNRYILDAHWIYPGDPLISSVSVTPVATLAAQGQQAAAEVATVSTYDTSTGPHIPMGSESDIYCGGYIGDEGEQFPYSVTGSEYQNLSPTVAGPSLSGKSYTVESKLGLNSGDILYVDGGSAGGLLPGTLLSVVDAQEIVRHPGTNAKIGVYYRYLGRLRILSVQDSSAIAEVAFTCRPVLLGSTLKVFEPEPVPLARKGPMRGVNDPVDATRLEDSPVIVRAEAGLISLGQDHVVYIDRGSEHDAVPGDIYTIYRLNSSGHPPLVLGELAVLSVQPRTSLARIIESRYTVYVGDQLVLK